MNAEQMKNSIDMQNYTEHIISTTDLHTHTNASDGSDTPEELVLHAIAAGIKILAITDHDTTEGIDAAFEENSRLGNPLRIIPGIEISTTWCGEEIHVLGYFIRKEESLFQEKLASLRARRNARNINMIERMKQDGLTITLEELKRSNPGSTITRAHFAKWLLEQGIVDSINEAFEKYLGHGMPYYSPRIPISPMEAIQIIKDNGALAFLAHPGQYDLKKEELEELIELGIEKGLRGIEVYHNSHSLEQICSYLDLADKYHLEISCGSDYHGLHKPTVFLGRFHGNPKISWL